MRAGPASKVRGARIYVCAYELPAGEAVCADPPVGRAKFSKWVLGREAREPNISFAWCRHLVFQERIALSLAGVLLRR